MTWNHCHGFILSIEIVIIALGTVLDQLLPVQIFTVAMVAMLATIGVYGIVALLVWMDDAGYHLIRNAKQKGFISVLGGLLVKALPVLISHLLMLVWVLTWWMIA
jgi:predicted DNA repair protein MutK